MHITVSSAVTTMNKILLSPITIALVSGTLMGLAFVSQSLWWAGVVGLTVLVYALTKVTAIRTAVVVGIVAGVTKMGFVYSWLWTIYPVDWMGNFSSALQLSTIGWVWFVASAGTGIALSVFTLVSFLKIPQVYRYALLPFVYVASEVCGSFLFSLFELGPGSVFNTQTSFGYLGYTLARHGVLGPVAASAGVYALSWCAALSALLFAQGVVLYERKYFRVRTGVLLGFSFALFIGLSFVALPFTAEQTGLRVVTVNTEYVNAYQPTATEKASRVREDISAFKAALQAKGDVIVFPETAYALSVFGSPDNVFSYIEAQTDERPLVIDSDGTVSASGEPVIRATVYDARTKSTTAFFKKFLVPSGEYVPYHLTFLMELAGFGEVSDYLNRAMAFKNNTAVEAQSTFSLPGVLFCSEVVSSKLVSEATRRATLPLLVHPVSHGWFHTPYAFWYQLDLILRTQARMAGLPIVQAANMWESRAYTANGEPVAGMVVWQGEQATVVAYDL